MDAEKAVSFDKPGYDGRLNYHAILKGYMVAIATASYQDDFASWVKLLMDVRGFVAPYIKSDEALKSEEEISKCESILNISYSCIQKSNQVAMQSIIRKRLRKATDNLYNSAKHLMLPVKSDTESELDMDEFFRGSDL